MIKRIIGIDPGKSGALAVIDINGNIIVTKVMPIAGKGIDIPTLSDWIYDIIKANPTIVCIEKVHSMPGQGVASMFSFGFNVGLLHGIVGAFVLPLYLVAPQTWKKVILAGTAKDKDAAIDWCRRTYPAVSLLPTERSTKLHSGIADAICIARYALEKYKDVL